MKKDEKFVITINRELGSGGRTIARKVADRLGVALYDKVLIKTLEEKYNLTSEEIEKLKGHSHSWWEDFKRVARLGEGWLICLTVWSVLSASRISLATPPARPSRRWIRCVRTMSINLRVLHDTTPVTMTSWSMPTACRKTRS